jgi:alpha-L-fucosidase
MAKPKSFSIYLALTILALSVVQGYAQQGSKDQRYQPTNASLSTHPLPEWYEDGKLGIFVCWGLYSVPGWAQGTKLTLEETLAKDGALTWFRNNPYAEWYLNSLKIEGSSTQLHHRSVYGENFSYAGFIPTFDQESAKWDPNEMADLFKQVGAAYVVLVTKFHDGFLLWPSKTPNPFHPDFLSKRDIVGELTQAVKARNMKMGFYYSSGLDWTFNDRTITNLQDLFLAVPQDSAYVRYIDTHWRELMERYDPAVLWADIGSPAAFDPKPLIADFYNRNPGGVVNNRHKMEMTPTGFGSSVHFDFSTPEYQVLDTISLKKWETVRGIGLSFGYNQTEDVSTFLSSDALVDMFVDIVSKNGNLLLNVGPKADGSIPPGQKERLLALGNWYQANGDAIRGTRPWKIATATGAGKERVRFTAKGEEIFLIALDRPADGTLVLKDIPFDSVKRIIAVNTGKPVPFSWKKGVLNLRVSGPESYADAFRILQR